MLLFTPMLLGLCFELLSVISLLVVGLCLGIYRLFCLFRIVLTVNSKVIHCGLWFSCLLL